MRPRLKSFYSFLRKHGLTLTLTLSLSIITFSYLTQKIPTGIFFQYLLFCIGLLLYAYKKKKYFVFEVFSFGIFFTLTLIFHSFINFTHYILGMALIFAPFFYKKISSQKQSSLAPDENMNRVYQMAEFGTLTSGFFHDLVNPVNAVSLNLEYLKNQTQNIHPKFMPYVNQACGATKKLEHYIQSVHKQIQTQSEKTTFLLSQEIFEVIEVLQYKAYQQNVTLVFPKNAPISYYGNMARFHQIVVNLLSNAIDAYDGLSNAEKKVIIELEKKDTLIELSIQDFGMGIPESVKPYIFDPLFTTKPSPKGLGIGLCMVKHRVTTELKGTISVKDTVPHGATFVVRFKA